MIDRIHSSESLLTTRSRLWSVPVRFRYRSFLMGWHSDRCTWRALDEMCVKFSAMFPFCYYLCNVPVTQDKTYFRSQRIKWPINKSRDRTSLRYLAFFSRHSAVWGYIPVNARSAWCVYFRVSRFFISKSFDQDIVCLCVKLRTHNIPGAFCVIVTALWRIIW